MGFILVVRNIGAHLNTHCDVTVTAVGKSA